MSVIGKETIISRSAAYLFKLVLFLAFPGLHLLASGRTKLGWMLLILVVASGTGTLVFSLEPSRALFYYGIAMEILFVSTILSTWVFVIKDINNLGQHRLVRPLHLLALASLSVFAPYPENYIMHVELSDQMCSTICYGEVAMAKMRETNSPVIPAPIQGDILVYESDGIPFTNFVLAGPNKTVCINNDSGTLVNNGNTHQCEEIRKLAEDEYFMVGRNIRPAEGFNFYHSGRIHESQIVGTQPVVVGDFSQIITLLLW